MATDNLVTHLRGGLVMASVAHRAADHIEQLEAAVTRANAATAAAYEMAAKLLDDCAGGVVAGALETQLCCGGHMCGCRGADVGEWLQYLIRALATPDQTAALDKLIAEAVKPLINAADAMLDAFCVHEDSAQIAASAGMMKAILAASKKGGV